MAEPTTAPPITPRVLVVVLDPATGEIVVTQADPVDASPMPPTAVAGLLQAAAHAVGRRHGVDAGVGLEEYLRAYPGRLAEVAPRLEVVR